MQDFIRWLTSGNSVESQVTVGPAGTSGLPGLKNGDKVFLKTLSILRVGLASLGLIAGGIFLY